MPAGVVIIGGGQAGVEAASALRAAGYGDPILLIGDEAQLPYQRPPLSKAYLLGTLDAARLPLRAEAYYEKQRIDLSTRADGCRDRRGNEARALEIRRRDSL